MNPLLAYVCSFATFQTFPSDFVAVLVPLMAGPWLKGTLSPCTMQAQGKGGVLELEVT